MKLRRTLPLLAVTTLLLQACGSNDNLIDSCDAKGGLTPLCGLQSPEDFAQLPAENNHYLLLSQMGGMGEKAGNIALLDTRNRETTVLFPAPGVENAEAQKEWGDGSCDAEPGANFSPHGTHLHQLRDGRWRYLVVNHGDREAVELFELQLDQDTPALSWRGCVRAASDTFINDVVGLSNGDLVYTRMFAQNNSWSLLKSMLKIDTGELWQWNRENGLKMLPASSGAMPNGIELSPDERSVFANMYMNEQVMKYNLVEQRVTGSANVGMGDNSAWAPNGELWVVTHRGSWRDSLTCFSDHSQTCGLAFAVVALNPESLQHRTVFEHKGAPMGAATVAVQVGEEVFLGSYAGDRLLIVPAEQFKE